MPPSLFSVILSEPVVIVVKIVLLLYPIWLPIVLGYIFWNFWIQYIHDKYFAKTARTLLEIKLPREVTKSPQAMELVLNGVYSAIRETTFIQRWWKGSVRPWFSLELVSLGGVVHFYMWIEKDSKNLFESQLYGQHPDIEIYEVSDYTLPISYKKGVNEVWATDYKLSKPDPYAIRTYVDYGQEKNPKEEEEIDPLTSLLEFLGSIKPEEQVWFQFVIRAHKGDFEKRAKKAIDEVIKNASQRTEVDKRDRPGNILSLTKGEEDLIAGIERKMSKHLYDTGIRSVYIAPKDIYSPSNIGGLTGTIRQFNSNFANGFSVTNFTSLNYPWQDFMNIRLDKMKRWQIDAYKKRMFFYKPYVRTNFVLSTEELATIYHIPGRVAQTPTLGRVQSKKSQAPSNLPI